ncbi:MAG: hypothetical protein HGGPFJEG_03078 [Ignavibacteria bacterium]|nr:hypothetical protein [Ignavibacteria bacterium]
MIKKRIKDSGVKQKWIASQLGMQESQLSEILNGSRKQKNITEIVKKINSVIIPFSNN